jgi:adenine-specific DNA methylase
VDINPVAWFILKCTLEYPQKLAGKTHPLPDFILDDGGFMEAFYKAHADIAFKAKRSDKTEGTRGLFEQEGLPAPAADLAWHVRAWGKWVLNRARRDLAKFYPTYADFEPLKPGKAYEKQSMRLVPLKDDSTPDVDSLNAEFSKEYLGDPHNPRWLAKATVAYLWARTVTCENCRATVPLLKTRWLCKKANKRVLLTMEPNVDKSGVIFGVEKDVPVKGGNAAQRREHDKLIGFGTLTQSGAKCSCCPAIMTLSDIQVAAKAHEWGRTLTAVVVDSPSGKEYRSPTDGEMEATAVDVQHALLAADPLGEPIDPTRPSPNARGLSGLTRYGITSFGDVFSRRQQAVLATLCDCIASVRHQASKDVWGNPVVDLLALTIDHIANRNSTLCHWDMGRETISSTFQRYALRVNWDFAESNPCANGSGSLAGAVEWIALAVSNALNATEGSCAPKIVLGSARRFRGQPVGAVDVVLTDPPYYDAIPYSDLSDFFYVWLRRSLINRYPNAFRGVLTEKSEELIQHAARANGNNADAKQRYESGMAESFSAMRDSLNDEGYLVIVFAHKQPDAWETLASSIVRSGFSVCASWPIETEMPNKAAGGARLASSVWLVCKKRLDTARPGWDNKVLEEMRTNIAKRLREFWDAGIRGPDFVWAATGPALEAYSKHPVVKKANDPGKTMEVGEFLSHVRRMVVDFVVGQVLTGDGAGADLAAADRMDAPTTYYLLHRHDFGLEEAPSGACILYATACGLSDHELEATWDILVRTGGSGGSQEEDEEDEDADPDAETDPESALDSGSRVKLKTWLQRNHKNMGYEAPGGQPVPLIDRIHRLMHLWRAGEVLKVDEYLDEHGLRRHELFRRLLQSLIELSPAGSDERSLLESLSNHVGAKGAKWETPQAPLPLSTEE